jgi:hypothetical protein
VTRMHDAGHSVQNHSYRHPYLTRLSSTAIASEIASTSRAVEGCTGVPTSCFRPPYGATSERVRASVLGHTEIMWTADSRDFLQPGVGAIVVNSLRGADGAGMIVLLHDGGGARHQTVAALPIIIQSYAARGYEFVSLCDRERRPAAVRVEAASTTVVPLGSAVGLQVVTPVRVMDSRVSGEPVEAGSTTPVTVAGRVPDDATAVVAQLTAVEPEAPGHLTVVACGAALPETSTLNVSTTTRAASAITPLVLGEFCVYSSTRTHLLVDVAAAFVPDGLGFVPAEPERVFDSRGVGPLPPGTTTRIALPGASAALVNITATGSTEAGYVTAWGCDQPRPDTSVLNHCPTTAAISNASVVALDDRGGLCLYTEGVTELIVDVSGTFTPDGVGFYQPAEPVRVLDTRSGVGGWVGYLFPGTIIDVPTTLESGATAVVTATSTGSDFAAYITLWGGGGERPATSNLNVDGVDVANLAGVLVDHQGLIMVGSDGLGSHHVVIDLQGWFEPVDG